MPDIVVTLRVGTWKDGINIRYYAGPDNNANKAAWRIKRVTENDPARIAVQHGFELWYDRELDPDHPQLPPQFRDESIQVTNFGNNIEEDIP